MKKSLILIAILLVAVACLSGVNAYLTNMVNGAQQDTITVLTTAVDQCFVTFDIENPGTEPIILNAVDFSHWSYNLGNWDEIGPNIAFTLHTNEGQWNASDNCINNLYFVDLGVIINPGCSKTFILMGDIWSNSNGGSKFSLGLSGSGNFNITGQTSGDVYTVNMIGPNWDNIFHIINIYQPMHKLSMYPFRNPVEIYPNYFQDEFWVYPGQAFWQGMTVNSKLNSVLNSIVTLNSQTYFGSTQGQLVPGNFFVTDYLSGITWNYNEYNVFNMSWISPNVEGVDACWLYETLMQTHLNPNQDQSEYTSAVIGNYNPIFGMVNETAQYEKIYHPYQAIKLDVDGNGVFTQEDLNLCQQNNVGIINLYGTNFNDNSAPNISRSSVIFFYPNNNFDQWLGNIFLNHQDNLPAIVQGLGIGQPYDGTWPNTIEATFNQIGNTITVDTDGNCIGVFGKLPNGEEWNTVVFMNGSENLRWSSESHSIEPEYIQMNRNQIQFQVPAGLNHIDVQARSLAQYTPTANDDSIIPVINPTLNQNSPNPFNPETSISYNLPKSGAVTIDIFNSRGQLIRTLVNETKSAGSHSIIWNGTDQNGRPVSSGIYFYKMKSGSYISTKKMVLMK